jgi:uncharacterized protein (TIGR04222 family)
MNGFPRLVGTVVSEPWGMSGPQFLVAYQLVLLVAVAYAVVSRWLIRRNGIGAGQPAHAGLSVPELAYLAGGPRRVVETAIAALVDSGALRPARRGTVQVVHAVGSTGDPVQAAVLGAAAERHTTTVPRLVESMRRHRALDPIRSTLAAGGLVVAPPVARARLRLAVAPLVVLFAVGLTRLVNGVVLHRPVGWLALYLAATAVLAVALLWHREPMRTARGQHALRDARPDRAGDTSAAMAGMPLAVGLVALGGLAAFPDDDVRTALLPRPGGDGGGGFVSCGGGGSSCGGGGGGCGG